MRTPVPVNATPCYIGIDPGLSGIVAAIYDNGSVRPEIETFETPIIRVRKARKGYRTEYDLQACALVLRKFVGLKLTAGLEHLIGYPALSSQALFGIGYGMGIWEMALAINLIPYTRVLPKTWKKELGVLVPERDDKVRKAASVLRAKQLFPWLDLPLVKHHNAADAILIAEYMRRKNPL